MSWELSISNTNMTTMAAIADESVAKNVSTSFSNEKITYGFGATVWFIDICVSGVTFMQTDWTL